MKFNKEHIITPLILGGIILLFFLLDIQQHSPEILGIQPYHYRGLLGVFFAPLLHSGWAHLLGNEFGIVLLSYLSFEFFGKITYWVIIIGWISTGLMVWAFPTTDIDSYSKTIHIGASGLVYVFAFFLLFSSLFNPKKNYIVLSLIIISTFAGIIWGIFPEDLLGLQDTNVSWQSHLSGALVGIILSYIFRNKYIIEDKVYDWEGKTELSENDQKLWDTYLQLMEEEKEEEKNQADENLSLSEKYYKNNHQNLS